MRVLIYRNHFCSGGANDTIVQFIEGMKARHPEIDVSLFTNHMDGRKCPAPLVEGESEEFVRLLERRNIDLIHWFKTWDTSFFEECVAAMEGNARWPKILMTLCQLPTRFSFRLSVSQIEHSDRFVFGSRAAFGHWLHDIIEGDAKRLIYFGAMDVHGVGARDARDEIVYGRGSALSKCPEDFLDLFAKIPIPQKRFVVVGGGIGEKFSKKADRLGLSSTVEFTGEVGFSAWLDLVRSFDVFLYHLPKTTHSLVDGTIQHAMLSEVPVVLLGGRGPEELVEHGVSGFVAADAAEFVRLATALGEDVELRRRIGENGRKRILERFRWEDAIDRYAEEYSSLMNASETRFRKRAVPFVYRTEYHLGRVWNWCVQKVAVLRSRLRCRCGA